MAPSRARGAEDPRPDIKERTNGGITKLKTRVSNVLVASGASKDNVSPASSNPPQGPLGGMTPTIQWSSQSSRMLNAYRIAHKLETPSAFDSTLNAAVLTAPGIGRRSPTMLRNKQKRKMPKEQLALAVRKHFNGSAVSESDVLVDFIYAVKNRDRKFKAKFVPPPKK